MGPGVCFSPPPSPSESGSSVTWRRWPDTGTVETTGGAGDEMAEETAVDEVSSPPPPRVDSRDFDRDRRAPMRFTLFVRLVLRDRE